MPQRKLRVGILFGGRSGEHEVSLASASSVLRALDRDRYEPVPIAITRSGRWLGADASSKALEAAHSPPQLPDSSSVFGTGSEALAASHIAPIEARTSGVDVVFPVLHGPFGEDGSVQGLLKTVGVPFVGADVLASALCMDKISMKRLFASAGLPQVCYVDLSRRQIVSDLAGAVAAVEDRLSYPVFVKPSNLGSSVGISRAANRDDLRASVEHAAGFDRRVIVEQAVDAIEVECGVLGNEQPRVSAFGQVVSRHEWYDYDSKYTEGLADIIIPAELTDAQSCTATDYALRAFHLTDCAGLARVDFFVLRSNGEVLINEINTMPGFTQTSMFPKLWEYSSVPYPDLISRLIELALDRHQDGGRRSVPE